MRMVVDQSLECISNKKGLTELILPFRAESTVRYFEKGSGTPKKGEEGRRKELFSIIRHILDIIRHTQII